MNKSTVKNVYLVLAILVIATMTACSLVAPAQEGNTVEVVLDGMGGGKGNPGGIAGDANVAWVRINVQDSESVQKGSGDLTKTAGVWRGNISVSETGLMTFTATAGNPEGTTEGVYHVSWAGSNDLDVTGSGLSLTIPVYAGDGTRHVFYVNADSATDGWRYLEAAPTDQSSGTQWSTTYLETHAIATNIGGGKANTSTIVSIHGIGAPAAWLCGDLVSGGCDDWFLPSRDELDAMYWKKTAIGGFKDFFYWSSTEDATWGNPDMIADIQDFASGDMGTVGKQNTGDSIHVRAVREF